jgi:hypothetical protein
MRYNRKLMGLMLIVSLLASLLNVPFAVHSEGAVSGEGTIVFSDSFSSGLGNWSVASGVWTLDSVTGSVYSTMADNTKGKIVSKADSNSWVDYANTNMNYEFSFKASYKDNGTDDRFVAIFRNNGTNFYHFKFVDASYTAVFGKNETTQLGTPVDVRTLIPGFSFNQMHSYKIIAFNNTFMLYIDDVKVLEASDNQITTGGNIGFIVKSASINFDDVVVKTITALPTPTPSVTPEPTVTPVPTATPTPTSTPIPESMVEKAQTLLDSAVEGYEDGQYVSGAIKVLSDAIAKAQIVLNDKNATQNQIDEALANLNTAISKFDSMLINAGTGDTNGSGGISIADLAFVAKNCGLAVENMTSREWDKIKVADINQNGSIDNFDLTFVARRIRIK